MHRASGSSTASGRRRGGDRARRQPSLPTGGGARRSGRSSARHRAPRGGHGRSITLGWLTMSVGWHAMSQQVMTEAARRRTFAIISHPDAGKTTLDREVPAVRRRDHVGRGGQGPRGPARGDVRLDGDGAEARHLDHLDRAELPVPRPRAQPARHARPPRLLRGHVSRAVGRRRRGDGARLGQGHRAADAEAVRGVPFAEPAGDHVPQQARPARHGAARTARPDRGADRAAPDAGDLAGRLARRVPRRDRPPHRRCSPASPAPPAARRSPPRRTSTADRAAAEEGAAWTKAIDERRLLDAVGADVDLAVVPGRRVDTGVRRFGADQLRCAPPARRRSSTWRRRRRRALDVDGKPRHARRAVLGVRVQGPGQHGSQPPRPDRLRPHLLGSLRARHGDDAASAPASRSPRSTRRRCSVPSAPRSTRRSPATSSVWSTPPG